MAKSTIPLQVTPVSILFYSLVSRRLVRDGQQGSAQAKLKALSAVHAAVATLVTLLALSTSPLRSSNAPTRPRGPRYTADGNLDDSENPLIQERSPLANAITAWETGYLLYDTWAMVCHAQPGSPSRSFARSVVITAQSQPALFGHHLALSSAFVYLQYYIYQGRERGIWIIALFLLMNASNPFMHARWWARRAGRSSRLLDVAFAAVFAASRFGPVAWVLRRYGESHGLGPGDALKSLRLPCQMGTGALTGLNALWWTALVNGMIGKYRKGTR